MQIAIEFHLAHTNSEKLRSINLRFLLISQSMGTLFEVPLTKKIIVLVIAV